MLLFAAELCADEKVFVNICEECCFSITIFV